MPSIVTTTRPGPDGQAGLRRPPASARCPVTGASSAISSPAAALEMPSQVGASQPGAASRTADDAGQVGREHEADDDVPRTPTTPSPTCPRRTARRRWTGRTGCSRSGRPRSSRPSVHRPRAAARILNVIDPVGEDSVDSGSISLSISPRRRRSRCAPACRAGAPRRTSRRVSTCRSPAEDAVVRRDLQRRGGRVQGRGQPGDEPVDRDARRLPPTGHPRSEQAAEPVQPAGSPNELTQTRSYASCSAIVRASSLHRRDGLGVDVEPSRRGRPRTAPTAAGSGPGRRSGPGRDLVRGVRAILPPARSRGRARVSWKATRTPSAVGVDVCLQVAVAESHGLWNACRVFSRCRLGG